MQPVHVEHLKGVQQRLLANWDRRHGCSAVNLLHIFRANFSKNTSGGLILSLRTWMAVSVNALFLYLTLTFCRFLS